MKKGYRLLGDFIRQIDIRNTDGKEDNLLGVSVQKVFIPSIANTVGTDFSKYKVVKRGQFTYIPDTSRRGDKIAIALLEDYDGGIVSNIYTVFDVVKSDELLSEYLMLWFSRSEFDRYARFKSHGSVREIFSWEEMCKIEAPIPSIDIQRKIIKIHKIITRHILLKRSINKNLLEQAMRVFSKLIYQKHKNGCIGDYCSVKSGFAFKSAYWQDYGVKVIKIASVNQDELDLSICSYVAEDKINLAPNFIVKGGDLLIAMTGATVGRFAMVPQIKEQLLVNQRVGKFFLGENPIKKLPFIYCQLKQDDIQQKIVNRGEGGASAQANVSPSDIMSIPCVIPSTRDIESFNVATQGLFQEIIDNQYQNMILTNMRNCLIPQLMSGKLEISDIVI